MDLIGKYLLVVYRDDERVIHKKKLVLKSVDKNFFYFHNPFKQIAEVLPNSPDVIVRMEEINKEDNNG